MATQAEIEAAGVAKEVAANKRRKDAGLTGSASDYETASNIRSQAAGFKNAAEQEQDANRRARLAGFKNAAEQEQDANRRARQVINPDTGQYFRNAAEQEIWNNSRKSASRTAGTTEDMSASTAEVGALADEGTPTSGSQAGPMTGYKVTFAYIKGMWYSFPNVQSAREAVNKYTGNMDSVTYRKPSGVAINTTLGWSTDGEFVDMNQWPDQVFAPEGVTGDALWSPPNNPITVGTTIVDYTGGAGGGGGDDDAGGGAQVIDEEPEGIELGEEPLDWSKLDQDLLNLAKRYADAGMMGRAKSAFTEAGGVWSTDVHLKMKEEREEEGAYGGLFEFDWASKGITDAADLEQIKTWAKGGLFGKIKQFMEANKPGSYDKDVHVKLNASSRRGKHDYVAPSTVTKDTPGAYLDTRTGKYKMPAPDKTTPGKVEEHVYDRATMKGKVKDISGKFKTGTAREDAKTWRQQHMDAAKKKLGVGKPNQTEAQKVAWRKKRNAIANRHRIMIGAGKKTLPSGKVLG